MKDNILKIIFEQYPNVWREPNRFRAILMDMLHEDKLRKNLLLLSVEENIPEKMIETHQITSIEVFYLQRKLTEACGCNNDLAEEIIRLWADALNVSIIQSDSITKADHFVTATNLDWGDDEADRKLKEAFTGNQRAIEECQRFYIDELPWNKDNNWSEIALLDFIPSRIASILGVVTLEEYKRLQLIRLIENKDTMRLLALYYHFSAIAKLVRRFVVDYKPTPEDNLYIAINVWNLDIELKEVGYNKTYGNDLDGVVHWLNCVYSDYNSGKFDAYDIDGIISEVEYKLGICYALGIGVEKDFKICKEMWRKSITRPGAERKVGSMRICKFFFEGKIHINHNPVVNIEKDYELAYNGFKEISHYFLEAKYYLAKFFEYGYYVDKDMVRAEQLYQEAAAEGYEPAKKREKVYDANKEQRVGKHIKIRIGMDIEEIRDLLGEISDLDIRELHFSLRTYINLSRAGIKTISDLLERISDGPEGMEKIPNLEEKSLKQMMSRMLEFGVEFPREYDDLLDRYKL